MFCQECGTKNEDSAKFCSSCGKPMSGHATDTPNRQSVQLEEKVFFNKANILVTDAVFRTPSGASYPIRNISSVAVTQKNMSIIALILGILFTLSGLSTFPRDGGTAVFMLIIGGPFLYFALVRPYYLQIGAGGLQQTAIEGRDSALLREVAKAINDAILFIQKGK